jgi:hypothetical protein
MTTYQVLKHVYNTATCKIATTKVGKPCLRTKARAHSDKLNDIQVKGDKPEGPLPQEIISYSIAPASSPIHAHV